MKLPLGSTSVAANTDGSLLGRQGCLPCVSACWLASPHNLPGREMIYQADYCELDFEEQPQFSSISKAKNNDWTAAQMRQRQDAFSAVFFWLAFQA